MNQKTILVVEDDAGMRESMQEVFTERGYRVLVAEDGEGALKKISSEEVDLVLLDIILPKKDGFEVLKEMKQGEKTKSIPVILTTNLSDPKDIQKALDLGATTYLIKSNYSLAEIISKVEDILA